MTGYSIELPPEPTGNAGLDDAELKARSALIDCLEHGRDPDTDEHYQAAEARVSRLKAEWEANRGDA